MRWWQSIRWQLALGSILVALLATGLLALVSVGAIAYYYGVDQKDHIARVASSGAEHIGEDYLQLRNLSQATADVLPSLSAQSDHDQQYLMIVLDRRSQILYPRLNAASKNTAIATFLVKLVDPTLQADDLARVRDAIVKGRAGVPTTDEIGKNFFSQPFVVQPITVGGTQNGRVVGILIVTPRSVAEHTIPPFVATVGGAVLMASPFIALLMALVALYFSRTIRRPLARLTNATRLIATGDYNTQVQMGAKGEIGELTRTFNDMAAQLSRDVEELHRQEIWRRELIMSITHDLATPLTAIAGLGEALVDGVNQSREDYEVTGRVIVRETLRLRRLVKDLHMMAKVEAGALMPQKEPVRLAALVDEVLAVLALEFERVQIEPHNDIPYTLPAILADPDMLMRVFSNLFDNALQHTPAGGTITVEESPCDEKKMLALSITDTGPGIPEEALPFVFERFYRADSARRSVTGGSGLGLAIVQAIVEAHGGKVWAENVPGAGARFVFTLPCQSSE